MTDILMDEAVQRVLIRVISFGIEIVVLFFTRKVWGKKLIPTVFVSLLILGYDAVIIYSERVFFVESFLVFCRYVVVSYYIVRCIRQQGNVEIFQGKAIFRSLFCVSFLTVLILFIHREVTGQLSIEVISRYIAMVMAAPVAEELCIHQIVYRCIEDKPEKEFFSMALLISLYCSMLHLYGFWGRLQVFVFFFFLFYIRYRCKQNVIWGLVVVHSLMNCISEMADFL